MNSDELAEDGTAGTWGLASPPMHAPTSTTEDSVSEWGKVSQVEQACHRQIDFACDTFTLVFKGSNAGVTGDTG